MQKPNERKKVTKPREVQKPNRKKKVTDCDKISKWQKIIDRSRELTDYDKIMSDFLASDKSEEYKRSILSLLNTDYSKYTYGKAKDGISVSRLNEINYKEFSFPKLKELATNNVNRIIFLLAFLT